MLNIYTPVIIIIIIIIIHEYYYGGAVALLLQDHLTMSVTEQSQYLSGNCSAGTQDMSGSQSTGKHSLNSTVFSSWRKATKVGAFLT